MNSGKSKVFLYIMVLITIINMGFVIAAVVIVRKNNVKSPEDKKEMFERRGRFMASELGFDEHQLEYFHKSRAQLREKIKPLRRELHNLNRTLIIEATSENPDRAKCNDLAQQIGSIHTRIKEATFMHIMEVSDIATPEQVRQLNEFYLSMFSDDHAFERKGPGKQYRARKGRGQLEEKTE
jgi:Spy/CpxP family protein refolding chaperone